MSDFDSEDKFAQRSAQNQNQGGRTASGSPEAAMHQTRMNVTRHRRAMRKGEGGAAPKVDIPEGGGRALEGGVKNAMEKKLGADLSSVRIHTGGDSAGASEKLNARAFTVGSDVHFNAGQFDPGSKEGTKLLAHELTHVVQGQKGGVQKKEEANAGAEADAEGKEGEALEVSDPEEPAEQEADAVADEVTADLGDGGVEAKAAGGQSDEGSEDGAQAAATEEKAPEAGAKLQAPISAKYSASALRQILRKKAYRQDEPELAPEAEATGENESGNVEEGTSAEGEGKTTGDEASAEEASTESEAPSQSVAAKLKGVHRKIFRANTQVELRDHKAVQDPSVAEPSLDNPLLHPYYPTFKARMSTLLTSGKVNAGSDANGLAESIWTKICASAKLAAPTMNDPAAYSNFARKWVNMESPEFKTAVGKFDGVAKDLAAIANSQIVNANTFGFWGKPEGKKLAEGAAEITLETSAIGGLFDQIPSIHSGGSWDPELFSALSQSYATAVSQAIQADGKRIYVCLGAGAASSGNIWAEFESKALTKGLAGTGIALQDKIDYLGAAAKTKGNREEVDATKTVGGVPGCVYKGPDRAAAVAAADAHLASAPA